MLFHKVPFAANFSFAESFDQKAGKVKIGKRSINASVKAYEGDIFHIQLSHEDLWTEDLNLVSLDAPKENGDFSALEVGNDFSLTVKDAKGNAILSTAKGLGFGVSGKQAMFAFGYDKSMKFYGLGEKTFGTMEVGKLKARFWNVDALGDFHGKQWADSPCDPYYASVPYVIVRRKDTYVGLLYHNPFETWIDTGTDPSFFSDLDENRKVILGSEDGLPSLWIIVGPSLAELTRKLQKLVGLTPRPPLWSLGYHQCRWEYKGEEHLTMLNEGMKKNKIPNDGLWLDIDYMDGYRVFTYAKDAFPKGVPATIAKFEKDKRRIVPIIDPGVKFEPGLDLYEDGMKKGVFCLNPEGKPFVGFVWPGETVFPDFSMKKARDWWAGYAKGFKELGFAGAWVDMNDPSTGAVDPYSMLFGEGKYPHGAFRNQYALGMQMATQDGFQQASPNERIFILSRSGYTGTSRYAALWTGDNVSNRFYLKGSIPTTLNLSLSGIPFNGPDVGGFMGDTNEPLMIDWMKAGFLFPFFRNHSGGSHRRQEPWTFGKTGLKVITWYTQLRYKLIPYLYQQFVNQSENGDPILRPFQYHYPGGDMPDDAFLVGAQILQAPVLEEGKARKLKLPGKKSWFDARWGKWVSGELEIECGSLDTPLYFADGAIIPTLPGMPTDNEKDLTNVEFHIFSTGGSSELVYVFDDGESLDFQKGKESRIKITAKLKDGDVAIKAELLQDGFGDLKSLNFMVYGDVKTATINGQKAKVSKSKITWTGKEITVHPVTLA